MKYFLLLAIRIYWLIPKNKRRKCVFTETCSHYVYTLIKIKGVKKGLSALRRRMKQCRPGYYIFKTNDGREWVLLRDKTIVERNITSV